MARKSIFLTGRRFGLLLVSEESPGPPTRGYHRSWLCFCDCGSRVVVLQTSLMRGNTQSCGCLQRARAKAAATKHGGYGSPTWRSYAAMRQRCENPKHLHYHNYGGRGISVCPEWWTYAGFLASMGERPSIKHSLDRIDNARGYEPSNTRWATRSEQNRNSRNNTMITYQGRTQCLMAWAEETGIKRATLGRRIACGWSVERAFAQ